MSAVDSEASAGASRDEAAALELRSLTKSFVSNGHRVDAVAGVSLRARRGRVTGLIGPDGAGKTTIMRLAAGLLTADAGSAAVLGVDVAADPLRAQAALGYMPQRFGLYEDLSVRENLDLYADLQGVPGAERAARYAMLMRMTGLGPFSRRLAGRLSGGMKQKLGLACTLIRTPHLLLLDEPTVGVDPMSRRELWSIVTRLVSELKTSVFLSTAYLDEAERCHEVVLLHEGRVLGSGPPGEFTRELDGRTWWAGAPGIASRRLQRRLAAEPRVIDAVVEGEGVRLLLDGPAPPAFDDVLGDLDGAGLKAVAPRFEDGFVEMLKKTRVTHTVGARHDTPLSVPASARDERVPIIEVDRLERRFGDFLAVRDITFT
ncbi:MAG: ABC transporter ATP-binding protein, partial [Gammaproteobacteria bacterium]|nr:ABC transporter ATP-binding protein [Gammaproteobacteria bacterium]